MEPAICFIVEDTPGTTEFLTNGTNSLVIDSAPNVVVEFEGILDADKVAVTDLLLLFARLA